MISAIVLAAGKSSRMGAENKMLLAFKGSTVIGSVINALELSIVNEIIIVDNKETSIKGHLNNLGSLKFVTNLDSEQGLTTSIQCGIRAASESTSGYLICLGDMPLLTYSEYNTLVNNYLSSKTIAILIPTFKNKRGNPVLFSAHFKDEILQLQEKNGCKPVVASNDDYVIEIPFPNNNCHLDIDTKEDYKQFK